MMRKVLFTGFAISLVAGCGSDPGTGRLELALGDAPFPFDMVASAQITVDLVQVRVDAEEDGESGWVTLSGGEGVYDLLELQNGITAHLAGAELPVGVVDQVRLVISRGRITLADARVFVLNVPSGGASGLKVFPRPPIVIAKDATTEVLLDVDVSQSFRSIPASPARIEDIAGFHFQPVLRVGNLSTGGSVAGRVFSAAGTLFDESDDVALSGATIMATANGDTATTASGEDGSYRILGLSPGWWKVEASSASFLKSSRVVEVSAGAEAEVDDLRLLPSAP